MVKHIRKLKNIKDIRDNNGIAIFVNEKNILEVETMLTTCQILGGRTLWEDLTLEDKYNFLDV